MFSLVITYCTPLMLNVWGVKTGYFFAAISLVGGSILLLTVPEVGLCVHFTKREKLKVKTKGRTYAELDELFERGIPARKFAKTKTSAQFELEARDNTA